MRKTDKAAISALFFFPKFPVYLGVYTHTPPEGGVSQMVAYRLLQVEVPEDTKR